MREIILKKIRWELTELIENTKDEKLVKKYQRILDYFNMMINA